jgi:DNA mismatch repair protein MutL
MPDIIRLLPDNVANQIAAGEVVQRPASVVKELLENSVDADASKVKLIVLEAGKNGILVIDNGKGMTENDARLAFERHATSKIQSAEDIFTIFTKGFRGEALASIAAVAQVDLKTKLADQELGTAIKVEGGHFRSQEFCNTQTGTRIEVKNLFYNIPARRNFLKSNNVELRHIIDEFERVALAHPSVGFEFTHNKSNLFELPSSNLRQRIVNVFGQKFNEKLVPVKEETPILKLHGFIGKPEFAKKTRGEQFFFANFRFIKNSYLHKAVQNAFEGLLQDGSFPTYFLFLELDPSKIDVNIHPTKTEIKFDDEKAIFSIIRTAVKHALGQYNIAPSLDFDTDNQFLNLPPNAEQVRPPSIKVDPTFNPFNQSGAQSSGGNSRFRGSETSPNRPISKQSQEWESLLNNLPEVEASPQIEADLGENKPQKKQFLQIGKKYILTSHGEGMILIHQQRAHEKIIFERITRALSNQNIPIQQLLFPQQLSFKPADFSLLENILPSLTQLGFDIDLFGSNEIIVQGVPLYLENNPLPPIFEQLIEDEKNQKTTNKKEQAEKMARVMAKVAAIGTGTVLEQTSISKLVDELFACQSPYVSLNGKAVVVNLNLRDIDKSFH